MKKILLISILIIMTVALFACAQSISINAGGMSFDVFEFEIKDSFGNVSPETDGNAIMTVRLSTDADTDPSAVTDIFFGEQKCAAGDGNMSYECKAVAMSDENNDTSVWLIFEVPAESKNVTFTILGNGFDSFSGTAK